jgi:pyruvate kinase
MPIRTIVTAPPYAEFLDEIARHPIVSGLRLNTVMPLKETPAEALARLNGYGLPVWVDLKGRQLRVVGAAIPPYTEVRLSHPISLDTPADAWFSSGDEPARILAVDGDRLILADGPRRLIGPGESLNNLHPSLKIHGTLTETDRAYLDAMRGLGLRQVMLSYVESPADVDEVRARLPGAEILLKIESLKGLEFARQHRAAHGHLVAARGDLFVEAGRPHRMARVLKDIITADPDAIVASRLFDSLACQPVPSSADIGDAAYLLALGYRTFMLGDQICFDRNSVIAALNLLEVLAGDLLPFDFGLAKNARPPLREANTL